MFNVIFGNDYDKITQSIAKRATMRLESVLSVSGIVYRLYQKSLLDEPVGFVVRYDTDFIHADEKDWQAVIDACSSTDLFLIYEDLDKRSKFYKFFKPYCIEYSKPIENYSFMFVDNVIKRSSKAYEFVQFIQNDEVIGVLALLYNRFRCILQIQSTPNNVDIEKNTGLDNKQIYWNKKYLNIYQDNELISILQWIDVISSYIKDGIIESKYALDYLLLNII